MLNRKEFDFSQESTLKEKLWEQMQKQMAANAPQREEVKLEELAPFAESRRAAPAEHAKPHQNELKSNKRL